MSNNLLRYINYIMSFFERLDCKEGEGLFLLRTMNAVSRNDGYQQEDMQIMYRVVHLLYCNEFLDTNNGFYKLTQKGYQYIQGAKDLLFHSYLNLVVDCEKDEKTFFHELWWMIGKEEKAPFYVTGPLFYNTICHYLSSTKPSYSAFMQERAEQGESTSRVVWYESLVQKLPKGEWEHFLVDLSQKIDEEYNTKSTTLTIPTPTSTDLFLGANETEQSLKKQIYISYAKWDYAVDKWVQKLANDLQEEFDVRVGLEMPLDVDMVEFTKESIKRSDKVLLVLTPRYKDCADQEDFDMGNKTMLVTEEIYSGEERIKFIPIVRVGTFKTSYPKYLGTRNGLDMTDDSKYQEQLEILKRNLRMN